MAFDYDLFVLGAGSAGLAAAERAARYGVRVAIAEQRAVGGTCVNRGCIPMELLDFAAGFTHAYQDAACYGWNVIGQPEPPRHSFDWQRFMAAKQQEIEHLNDVHTRKLQRAGVELLHGQAVFVDEHTLKVGDRRITAEKILIAVGGKPFKPPIAGIEHAITSRELFEALQQPKHIAIIGGGYIGTGFASGLNGLGSHVTQIVMEEQVLPGWDDDIRAMVAVGMNQRGVQIFTDTQVDRIAAGEAGLQLTLKGQQSGTLVVDTLVAATGRIPNTADLGLEQAGVKMTETGAIAVDAVCCTSQPHIFAVGDCIDRVELTPVAIAEGRTIVDYLFQQGSGHMSYDWIPAAITSRPSAAMIGLTEAKAREEFGDAVQCYRKEFKPLFFSLTQRTQPVLMKIVVNREDSDRILGVHMVGEQAREVIQGLTVALRMGATKGDLDDTIGIHPSIGEEFFSC